MSFPNIKLSLCLIVRDEETYLSRCLKSVTNLVDEIIVVDTGSKDSSIQIAEQFGAKVFKSEWEDNFSKARNQALEKAGGSWILVLDADEILGCTSREALNSLLQDQESEGYFIKIISILGNDLESEISEDWVVRLFRNKPEYRFHGVIHEQVKPAISSVSGDSSIKMSNLTIYHDGYLAEHIQLKEKVKRNSSIIQKAIAENPDNPFLLYSLGCEFFLSEDYQTALLNFQKTLSLLPVNEGYLGDLMIKTGLCLYMLEKKEEFIQLFRSYKEQAPLAPEMLFLSGLANLDRGNLSEAEEDIKKCLETIPTGTLKHFLIKEHQLYQALAEIHEQKSLWEDAAKMYFMSVKAKPTYLYPVQKIIDIYRASNLLNIDYYLDFCSPEKKYTLLEKLHWHCNLDTVGFIILGLLRDILQYINNKEHTLAQLLSLRAASLLNLRKVTYTNIPQFAALIALSNAFLILSSAAGYEIGGTMAQCGILYEQIKDILFRKEPVP